MENVTDLDQISKTTIESGDEYQVNHLILAKIVAMLVLGLCSFLLGALPIKLSSWLHWSKDEKSPSLVISLLLCFGGGVLLFTTFLHLQPEVREAVDSLVNGGKLPRFGHGIHLAELIFCVGFFFVYLVEELVHAVLDRRHHEQDDEAVLHRTMSLRRCSKHPTTMDADNTLIPRANLTAGKPIDNTHITASTQGLLNPISIQVDKQAAAKQHGGHSHSHFNDSTMSLDGSTVAKSFRGLLAVLALSFHAVFEGLAVGLEGSVANVWYLFAAIATHKLVIAFCVGVELVNSKTRLGLTVLYLATFAAVTPLGIGVGIALSDQDGDQGGVVAVVLQGMAAGTLLYVIFFEVLQRERANTQMGIWQLLAIMTGFAVMFGLQIACGHEHSHGDHCHQDAFAASATEIAQTSSQSSHSHHDHHDHNDHHGHHH